MKIQSKTKKHFPSIIMVLLVKISNKKKFKPLFKKIINAPYDVPLQYYGIGMLHKTQVKVKGTLNCDVITTTCTVYAKTKSHKVLFYCICYITLAIYISQKGSYLKKKLL